MSYRIDRERKNLATMTKTILPSLLRAVIKQLVYKIFSFRTT